MEKNNKNWFVDAKFGMFVHWGLYSILGGEYKGDCPKDSWYSEWIQARALNKKGIPRNEYKKLLNQFNPVDFNAEEWIKVAATAGMKYFLITAKHHDGFALWPSKVSSYNIVEETPFKRDVLGELKDACEKYNVALGFYYSHWHDWDHPGGKKPDWGEEMTDPLMKNPTQEQFETYWMEKSVPQVIELMKNYKPKFFWFDNWKETEYLTEKRLDYLIETIRNIDPNCLINSRIGTTWNHSKGNNIIDYISLGDFQFSNKKLDKPWESPSSMNRSWGYHKKEYFWFNSQVILKNLVKNVSLGGNYSLNIGPMGNGKLPNTGVRILGEVGSWLKFNGESIYGASPCSIALGKDGCVTQKSFDNILRVYLHVYEPKMKLIFSLPDEFAKKNIMQIALLESEQSLEYQKKGDKITILFPQIVKTKRRYQNLSSEWNLTTIKINFT